MPYGSATNILVEQNVAGQLDWWPADMEHPVHRLYDETDYAEHHYWLWRDGRWLDELAEPTPDSEESDYELDEDDGKRLGKPRRFLGMPLPEDFEEHDDLDYWNDDFWEGD